MHLLYKTTCITTGKFYIGIHSTTNINDGYLGSGIRLRDSIRQFGRESHIREILHVGRSRQEIVDQEKIIVDEEMILNPMCLNLGTGGGGPCSLHPESRAKIGAAVKLRIVSDETKKKKSLALLNKPKSKEHRQSLSVAVKGKPSHLKGRPRSEETKRKMSETIRQRRGVV